MCGAEFLARTRVKLAELEIRYAKSTGQCLAWEVIEADLHSNYPMATAYLRVAVGKGEADSAAAEIAGHLADAQVTTHDARPGWYVISAEGWLDDDHSGQVEVFVSVPVAKKLADCDDPEVLEVLANPNIQHTEAAAFATEHGWPASESAVRRWRKNPTVVPGSFRVLEG